MSLKERIDAEIKTAMKAKDKIRLTTLRSIKSMILLAGTEKGASADLSEAAEMTLLAKAAKQRKDSGDTFVENGRNDLAENEFAELKIIQEFLPQQLSEEDVTNIIQGIVAKTGASSMKDMGKVMGMASKELAGKADNKIVSQIVKKCLA